MRVRFTVEIERLRKQTVRPPQSMSLKEYLAEAERCRQAKVTATDPFTRNHLEAIERSFRILAESETALRRVGKLVDDLDSRKRPVG